MPTKPHPKTLKSTKPTDGSSSPTRLTSSNTSEEDTISSGQILNAIHTMKEDFVSRFDGLLGAIQGVQSELKALTGRMTEAEDRISTNEDDLTSMKTQTSTMKAAMDELVLKVDDLENRARRSNVRLVGLPELTEGGDVRNFLEKWIPEALGEMNFTGPLLIERAHRVGRINSKDGNEQTAARPRVVVMKFLNYADKVRVRKAARSKGRILVDDKNVMFFPDVSVDLLKRRKVFDSAKKELASLSNRDLRYGIIHPATLLVTIKGRRHTFDTASEAEAFVQELKSEQS